MCEHCVGAGGPGYTMLATYFGHSHATKTCSHMCDVGSNFTDYNDIRFGTQMA